MNILLVLICFFFSCFSNSIISTQNEVVKDVRAESALEYAAAMIPIIKRTPTYSGNPELRAIFGNNISGSSGILNPISFEYIYNNAPRARKRRSTKIKIVLKQSCFFWHHLHFYNLNFFAFDLDPIQSLQ